MFHCYIIFYFVFLWSIFIHWAEILQKAARNYQKFGSTSHYGKGSHDFICKARLNFNLKLTWRKMSNFCPTVQLFFPIVMYNQLNWLFDWEKKVRQNLILSKFIETGKLNGQLFYMSDRFLEGRDWKSSGHSQRCHSTGEGHANVFD